MSRYSILLLLCISQYSIAQNKTEFLEYLIDNKLYSEFNSALRRNETNLPKDSLAYYQLKSAILQKQSKNIELIFNDAKYLVKKDSFLMQDFASLLLDQTDSLRNSLFSQTISRENDSLSVLYSEINKSIDSFKLMETTQLPQEMSKHFEEYKKYQNKKPIIAASLSLLFPGLGKQYLGRKHAFRFIVLSQTIFGLKLGEAIYRLGILHPYSFLTGGIFLLYYGSSIVGSYYDCIEVKKEQKQIYINHAKDFINHTTDN